MYKTVLYQKTEKLLYNYRAFKEIIKEKQELIDEGDTTQSKDIITISGNDTASCFGGSCLAFEKIEQLKKSLAEITFYLTQIDRALYRLKKDKYFKIIPFKYFDGKTIEEIASVLGIHASKVNRSNKRLVVEISKYVFFDDFFRVLLSEEMQKNSEK